MITSFQQKNLLGSKTIELYENEIKVITKDVLSGKVERRFDLRDLNNKIDYIELHQDGVGCLPILALIALGGVFMVVGLLEGSMILRSIFLLLTFIGTMVLTFRSLRQQYLEIRTKFEPIQVRIRRSNEAEARRFMDKIIEQIREYFRSRYMFVDPDLPVEMQIKNYKWLEINNLITKAEYEVLKLELKRLKSKRM